MTATSRCAGFAAGPAAIRSAGAHGPSSPSGGRPGTSQAGNIVGGRSTGFAPGEASGGLVGAANVPPITTTDPSAPARLHLAGITHRRAGPRAIPLDVAQRRAWAFC